MLNDFVPGVTVGNDSPASGHYLNMKPLHGNWIGFRFSEKILKNLNL